MKRAQFAAVAGLLFAQVAGAQDFADGWKTDLSGEVVLVTSSMDDVWRSAGPVSAG